MKKIFIITAILIASVTAANAQWFVGGSAYALATGGKTKAGGMDTDKTAPTAFLISPEIGYQFGQKTALSLNLSFGMGNLNYNEENEDSHRMTLWAVMPKLRYECYRYNRVAINIDGSAGVFGASIKDVKAKLFGYGIGAVPTITFDLSPRITLQSTLNFMQLGFASTTIKNSETEYKDVNNAFYFGASTNTVATTGNLTIGFIYRF